MGKAYPAGPHLAPCSNLATCRYLGRPAAPWTIQSVTWALGLGTGRTNALNRVGTGLDRPTVTRLSADLLKGFVSFVNAQSGKKISIYTRRHGLRRDGAGGRDRLPLRCNENTRLPASEVLTWEASLLVVGKKQGHRGADCSQQPFQLLQVTPRPEQASKQDAQDSPFKRRKVGHMRSLTKGRVYAGVSYLEQVTDSIQFARQRDPELCPGGHIIPAKLVTVDRSTEPMRPQHEGPHPAGRVASPRIASTVRTIRCGTRGVAFGGSSAEVRCGALSNGRAPAANSAPRARRRALALAHPLGKFRHKRARAGMRLSWREGWRSAPLEFRPARD
jgi:hypothetical protein